MKSYFKYTDEDSTECFLELDEEFYCERAVYKTKHKLINTYLTIEKEPYFLPEGNLKDGLEFMNLSSKEEFDILWKESMLESESDWNELKMKYKIGEKVKSRILCFYPTGIISNFGEKFNAISDYKTCREKFGKERMYPNNEMELIISKFDNTNKTVELKINE
jgi:ribosomal protein S1